MKIGWGWLGRLIFGVISLTISVLASCYCSVVICGDQINYQKIKQISCICQPAVCDCRPVWICVEKIKVYICFHYFMNRLVYSYSSIYREREREARTGQDRQKDLRTVAGGQKELFWTFLLTRCPLPCIDITQHPSTSIRLGKVECQNATAVRIGLRQKARLPGYPLNRLIPFNKRRVCQKWRGKTFWKKNLQKWWNHVVMYTYLYIHRHIQAV